MDGKRRRRHSVPARLSRFVQPVGDGQQGARRQYRRVGAERADGRLHLRKGQKFGDRVYGEARLTTLRSAPGRRSWAFPARHLGRSARAHRESLVEVREKWGGEAILPFSYGGSNGLLTNDTLDAVLFRRFGSSRLARTVCAAPTGAAAQALYGKMPCVTYEDYPEARLIVLWGVNPSTSGIHLVPYIRQAQKRGARLIVVDPRATPLARQADLHLAPQPGSDVAIALAIHRHLFEKAWPTHVFSPTTRKAPSVFDNARETWTFQRAAESSRRPRGCGATARRRLRGARPP